MAPIDPDAVEHIPSEAASTYRKLAEAYGREYYHSVAEEIAAQLCPGDVLLDAGTGPGILPIAIAERTDSACIHAFDFTRELVAHGRELAGRRGVDDRVSFFVADCYAIPTVGGGYPYLLSTGVLHSLDDPDAVLEEFHRVLEPGGTAWVFDPAVLDVPEDPEIELTDHERAVFDAYGVRAAAEQQPLPMDQARRIAADSPFADATVRESEHGDVRLVLSRSE